MRAAGGGYVIVAGADLNLAEPHRTLEDETRFVVRMVCAGNRAPGSSRNRNDCIAPSSSSILTATFGASGCRRPSER
jgi:hypothetical protein